MRNQNKKPLRVLVLSLFPIDDEGQEVLKSWMKFWFPRNYPVNVYQAHVALMEKGEWAKWQEQRRYDWYLVVGTSTMQHVQAEGGFAYGVFKTVVPHPQVQNSSIPLAHLEIADLCRNLCRWRAASPEPEVVPGGGTVINLFRSRKQLSDNR